MVITQLMVIKLYKQRVTGPTLDDKTVRYVQGVAPVPPHAPPAIGDTGVAWGGTGVAPVQFVGPVYVARNLYKSMFRERIMSRNP